MIFDLENIPFHRGTGYPQLFKATVAGRLRKKLGHTAGLTNFGVNLTTLEPKSASALRHWHSRQDEFIYVVSGELVLITDDGETVMKPGMMAAFPAGESNGHCLVNRTRQSAVYLEVGDRTSGDVVTYPDVDLLATETAQGYAFTHKDGTPYD